MQGMGLIRERSRPFLAFDVQCWMFDVPLFSCPSTLNQARQPVSLKSDVGGSTTTTGME
jgi:hypothetical protein